MTGFAKMTITLFAAAASAADYQRITSGTCSDIGMEVITTKHECYIAGQVLGLAGGGEAETTSSIPRPEGCYYNGYLWVSINQFNEGNGADATRHPICKKTDEWECQLSQACNWGKYKEEVDFGYYSKTDEDCTRCKAQCDNDPKCWAIECDDGYCSWWRTGVCREEDYDDGSWTDTHFFTCRNPAGVIDSLAKLEEWCSASASNCMTCRGYSGEADGSNCITNPKVIAKCRKFKGNDVCDRIVGCHSVTTKKYGKKKCKGKKHGLA